MERPFEQKEDGVKKMEHNPDNSKFMTKHKKAKHKTKVIPKKPYYVETVYRFYDVKINAVRKLIKIPEDEEIIEIDLQSANKRIVLVTENRTYDSRKRLRCKR